MSFSTAKKPHCRCFKSKHPKSLSRHDLIGKLDVMKLEHVSLVFILYVYGMAAAGAQSWEDWWMRVRVPCPGHWIMEIPSLGRANPVMIGLHHWAPEHYSAARLTPDNTAAAACHAVSQKDSLSWQYRAPMLLFLWAGYYALKPREIYSSESSTSMKMMVCNKECYG